MKELESIHYDELACAADYAAGRLSREEGRPVMYGPFSDQDFYSGHPLEHGFIEDTRDVPVLCGSVFGILIIMLSCRYRKQKFLDGGI